MPDTKTIVLAANDGLGLEGQVSGHFGRCPAYVVAEVNGEVVTGTRVVQNPFYTQHTPGVVPTFIRDLGANVIIAGGMGPRAIDMFNHFGIEVATGTIGNVRRVLEAYLQGQVKGIVPCEHDHPDSCGGHHDEVN